MRRFELSLLASLMLLVGSACAGGDNVAPELDPIANQVVAVGAELDIALHAMDPDGDAISFGFSSDLAELGARAELVYGGSGRALFKFVPIGSDVGHHVFRFSVSDFKDETVQVVDVVVKSSTKTGGTPVFVKPLGTGTTLDLGAKSCIDLPIEIQDADSQSVSVGQEPPLVDGASIEQDQALGATWHWCPTPEQASASALYPLSLSADDGDNPKVIKNYLIVLQKQNELNCPGAAPTVSHTPSDPSTSLDLVIDASVSDDVGLQYPPLLYYSESDPGPSPDLGQMTQITMSLASGDMTNGDWQGSIPNPVANQAAGSSATLYYLVVATDDDDATGDCDHTTRAPSTGSFSMIVTSTGQAACVDDSNEDDDNPFQALNASLPYTAGAQKICAGDDDWYAVQLWAGATLQASIAFDQTNASEDLDLYLYDSNGSKVTNCSENSPGSCDPANGASGDSNENLKWPINQSGTYYVVVHGWQGSSNQYDICIDDSSGGCPTL